MAGKRIFDICYKDASNAKAKWQQIGILLESADGKLSIKMNLLPVKLDSWWGVFPRKEGASAKSGDSEDDVPF
jgi:hypothetical protein